MTKYPLETMQKTEKTTMRTSPDTKLTPHCTFTSWLTCDPNPGVESHVVPRPISRGV